MRTQIRTKLEPTVILNVFSLNTLNIFVTSFDLPFLSRSFLYFQEKQEEILSVLVHLSNSRTICCLVKIAER